MATSVDHFDSWLCSKLISIDADESILLPYIKIILDGEESISEKYDSLKDIIQEFTGGGKDDVCKEIVDTWASNSGKPSIAEDNSVKDIDFENQLQEIMERQIHCSITEKKKHDDKDLKQAILAQYAEVSDQEEEEPDSDENPTDVILGQISSSNSLLVRNVNAESVIKAEKEKREKSKQDAQKKKEQDKLSREKQKQIQQERKEKEKKRTQKGERRR